jgi:hypothetical protein
VSEHIEFEEEEFDTSFNGQTIRRLLSLLKPYTVWVLGFLSCGDVGLRVWIPTSPI